jgi:dihydroorotate dehydrogenase
LSLYTSLLRPALFTLDAERAHDVMLRTIARPAVSRALRVLVPQPPRDARLHQRVLGLSFDHPLGLAAGLDKQGTALAAWAAVGFAFAEIGTVTPRPQPGNPRPRLFRLPSDSAVINRFGFNSAGAEDVARNLAALTPAALRIGVNLGKNKETPNERAADDYARAVDALHPFAQYFVVNVSSPNTKGLRDLQESRALRALLDQVVQRVRAVTARPIPVLVKVSPDMAAADLLAAVDAALEGGAAGVVATNTTTARSGLVTNGPVVSETGGLSGAPLRKVANDACALLFKHLGRRVPLIGVGGISSADDAYARIRAGASLVQIYTALIYEGPALVANIVRGVRDRLARDGLSNVQEAIGIDVH